MTVVILVRYGELALKSAPVRREFENTLKRNILDQFLAERANCRLRADHGHLYVEADDASLAVRVLCRVFGVTSVSEVTEVATDLGIIQAEIRKLADRVMTPGCSFAVRARRTGQHPFTSQELARDLGAEVLKGWKDRGVSVDLDSPAVELHVEVRGSRTYIYTDRHRGPGGLPLGVAGRVVALVDGRRGALGAYLMMKRGCRCGLVVAPSGEPLVRQVLSRFDPKALVNLSGADPAQWDVQLLRLAENVRADGIVLPLTVDDYADARARWGDRVLFSPTVGLDEQEVEERWRNVESLAA